MNPQSQNGSELMGYVREANLSFFINDRLFPLTARVARGYRPSNVLVSLPQAELLEAFVWLHSGVKIGYFQDVLSRRVFYEYSHMFLHAHEAVLESKVIETWFPSPIRNIWESEFSGRQQLFSSGQRWTDSAGSENFISAFQMLLLLSNGFAEDRKARSFVYAMTSSNDEDWEHVKTKKILNTSALEGVSESEVELYPVSDGFLAVMEYMRAVRHAVVDIRDRLPSGEVSAISLFVDLLKEAQLWRLNFGYTGPRLRFLQVARLVADEFVNLDQQDVSRSTLVEAFLKEIEQLMRDWGAPQAAIAG
jgi:hypothetical protein